MASGDRYRLGYRDVDDNPNLPTLIATMDAASQWGATRELRKWERERLQLDEGERLLDVGCGPGDAALALAEDLGQSGELVGVDASAAMLMVARSRSDNVACQVRFSVGDAIALNEPDHSFDAVRSERTLQWVADPQAAVAEMTRVLRPNGRIVLIDTDWSTLRLDVGDHDVGATVQEGMRNERARPSNVGSRLVGLVEAAGLRVVATTSATQRWTHWDPDTSPTPDGCFSMRSLADDLASVGQLKSDDIDRFVDSINDAARRDNFAMSLTMFAVCGTTSAPLNADPGDRRTHLKDRTTFGQDGEHAEI